MRHLAAIAAVLALVACSSSNDGNSNQRASILEPDLELFQIIGPAEQNYPSGRIEVQYGVRISNRSSEPLTLRRIQVEPMGIGGPYRLRRDTYFFNRTIKPGGFEDLTFWARADARGDAFATDAQAPVTFRGTAYFHSPDGEVRKVFVKTLNQPGTSAPR